ncbi:copper resistance CopC family protein [Pseudonocardia nigra]|uniref:copper resistance CopC family protein n=1 Tax=Pseudonocardia nigra TaxID=1921578 RepID=UPI001C5F0C33|nr:copper resistance CopC family protein [Pseudonocardia nigra]
MTTRALRAVAVTLLCGLALLLGTTPALAHARLQGSDPADGTSTATGPERVTLTFNETMQPGFATVTVVGPDGTHYEAGDVTAEGRDVSIGVQPLGPAGEYQVGYRVVSEDGHPVTGSVTFTLTEPGPAAGAPAGTATGPSAPADAGPTSAPPAEEATDARADGADGGAPVWPWIVGAAVLVAGGVVAALRLGRG